MVRGLRKSLGPLAVLCVVAGATPADAQQHQALTIQGNIALWTVAIKADKTADFETIMAKLSDGLSHSATPERRQQAAGWKIMRVGSALPDGTIAYVHIINPVVPNADYTIMQVLYDEFPEERQALYELYRGAFHKNLSMATGTIRVDLSAPVTPTAPDATPLDGAPAPPAF
jgi:hypothetical protein